MMKKICTIGLVTLLIWTILPINVFAEEVTYGSILDELARAQKELDANNQSIHKQEGQIDTNNQNIKNLQGEIVEMANETTTLQQQIADAETEIEAKKEQTKNIAVYYQMSQGDNIYLEYIFGGDNITDLVYRLSVVEQITEYNEKVIGDLQNLITANENRKVELSNKEQQYNNKIDQLNTEIGKLTNSVSKLSDLSPSLKQEVDAKRQQVEYYKSQGCKNRSDVIGRDCAVTTATGVFNRPVKTGYITSFVGYRWGSLHRGLDIGSSERSNAALYSIGTGVIKDIWQDRAGAKNITVQYRTTKGQYYTAIYAHLSRYGNIREGMTVTPNTVLGYMGATGHAYGVHLHLEVWPCRLYEDSNCKTWNKYVQFTKQQFNNGFKGATSVISFPSKTYQTWYTK